MDDFPDAEDEYEMLHQDELEMMREFESEFHLLPLMQTSLPF